MMRVYSVDITEVHLFSKENLLKIYRLTNQFIFCLLILNYQLILTN